MQYKIHAKLYVAVSNTISAYDELKMEKTRMKIVDSAAEITAAEARFRKKLVRHQVPQLTQIFTSRKLESEKRFALVNGRSFEVP